MKILFTGHRGFLGRELIPELRKDVEILVYNEDLRDFKLLNQFVKSHKIDGVINAAAKVKQRDGVESVNDLIDNLTINFNITRLELRTLSFCSGKIFGWHRSIEGFSESIAGSEYPKDFYGQSKFIFREMMKENAQITLGRFFNVFGPTESSTRFVRANLTRYRNAEPMIINQNIKMDFFYVLDSIFFIRDWLLNKNLPNEINLVYEKKYDLFEICTMINRLGSFKVPIKIIDHTPGFNYYGDPSLLSKLDYPFLGLQEGLMRVFQSLAKRTPDETQT